MSRWDPKFVISDPIGLTWAANGVNDPPNRLPKPTNNWREETRRPFVQAGECR
jgi:hypothetical protein